jgi:hypothetical protein
MLKEDDKITGWAISACGRTRSRIVRAWISIYRHDVEKHFLFAIS